MAEENKLKQVFTTREKLQPKKSSYDNSGLFRFNLVPPKSKAEIVVLTERDNSFFYSFILIFVGMLVFLILTIIHTIIVSPRLSLLDIASQNRDVTILSFDEMKRLNGELIIKSQALEPILQRDIKISELLQISGEISAGVSGARVLTYSREAAGRFVVNFNIPSYDSAYDLLKAAKNQGRVSSPKIRSISINAATKEVTAILSFNVDFIKIS